MKKTLVMLLVIVSTSAWASPFLVCDDPNPTEEVTEYRLMIDGTEYFTPAPLHFDLSFIVEGTHSVTAFARNMWGESAASVPLAFERSLAVAPSGVTITQE
jgi:hypothetical protein